MFRHYKRASVKRHKTFITITQFIVKLQQFSLRKTQFYILLKTSYICKHQEEAIKYWVKREKDEMCAAKAAVCMRAGRGPSPLYLLINQCTALHLQHFLSKYNRLLYTIKSLYQNFKYIYSTFLSHINNSVVVEPLQYLPWTVQYVMSVAFTVGMNVFIMLNCCVLLNQSAYWNSFWSK